MLQAFPGALLLASLTLLLANCKPDAGARRTAPSEGVASLDSAAKDCATAPSHIGKVVCAANAFLATLPPPQRAAVNIAWTDGASRTKWSNLPGVARPGVDMAELGADSQKAALALMGFVLSSAGTSDLNGVRAADDYLESRGRGSGYSSGKYRVAIAGTPSETGRWEILFGGHHLAYNVNYVGGAGYPIPNHLGVEPKSSFSVSGSTYAPMADESEAILAIFKSLAPADLSRAYLEGQTFSDVLIGPVEYGTGSSSAVKSKYPKGTNRTGVAVASLSAAQKVLVTAAIRQWVDDYDPAIAAPLLNEYTLESAYADTYLAWGGSRDRGVDPDVNGTYVRIDGPRVWIEMSCQPGVVERGVTHYHSIYRDKQYDYGATL